MVPGIFSGDEYDDFWYGQQTWLEDRDVPPKKNNKDSDEDEDYGGD
jgi:hypothetical protein